MNATQSLAAEGIKALATENFNLYPENYPLTTEVATDEATEAAQDLAVSFFENKNEGEEIRDEQEGITQIDYTEWVMEAFAEWVQNNLPEFEETDGTGSPKSFYVLSDNKIGEEAAEEVLSEKGVENYTFVEEDVNNIGQNFGGWKYAYVFHETEDAHIMRVTEWTDFREDEDATTLEEFEESDNIGFYADIDGKRFYKIQNSDGDAKTVYHVLDELKYV